MRYRHYLLVVLATILAFTWGERVAFALLLQSIKGALHLSDTELGTLGGIAFAAFYAVMGIPIGRMADRGNRVMIVCGTVALWGVAVVLSARAETYLQLLLVRVGVAVGEAGCIPPAQSLIAEYFPREARPRAVAMYFLLGGVLSTGIGDFASGWLNQELRWRWTLVAIGAPGLLLAGVGWLILQEPRRGGGRKFGGSESPFGSADGLEGASPETFWGTVRSIFQRRTYRNLLFGFCITTFFAAGIGQWQPTYFIRTYGLTTGELGTWLALIYGLGYVIGTYAGGAWASRWAACNEALQLRAASVSFAAFAIVSAGIYVSGSLHLSFILTLLSIAGVASSTAPIIATIQTLVPAGQRAMSFAVLYLFSNLIGLGLGPLAVGILSDALGPVAGTNSLRYALLAMSPGYLWGGWHLWRASKTVRADVIAVINVNEAMLHEGVPNRV